MTTMAEFIEAQPKDIPGLSLPVDYYWGGGYWSEYYPRPGSEFAEPRADLGYLLRANADCTESGEPIILFRVYQILKVTPKGVRIAIEGVRSKPDGTVYQHSRFVSNSAMKQFASATAAEAIEQLRHRNLKYVKIMQLRLEAAINMRYELAEWDKSNQPEGAHK